MKRLYIPVLATVLLGFTTAVAAAPAAGGDDSFRQLRHLQRVLDLTELQQQAIENAIRAARPELAAVREAARANREALDNLDVGSDDYASRLAELSAEHGRLAGRKLQLHGELRAAIDAQLTDEQRATLAEARQQRESRRGEHRRHRRGAADSDTR